MPLWIQSNWLGRVKVHADGTKLEENVKQKGQNGCRYVCVDDLCDVYVTGMFDRNRAVPDVNRYKICKSNSGVSLIPHDESRIQESDYKDHPCEAYSGNAVVLLLESPHRKEYGNCHTRKAPAQGVTGTRIREYLGRILNDEIICQHIPGGSDTRVVLCNPVQFQTSLHTILGVQWRATWRNRVWLALWDDPCIRRCFKARMELYSPNLVINACTGKGSAYDQRNRNSLKMKVSEFLFDRTSVGNICETGHPSGWHLEDNRAVTRVHSGMFREDGNAR